MKKSNIVISSVRKISADDFFFAFCEKSGYLTLFGKGFLESCFSIILDWIFVLRVFGILSDVWKVKRRPFRRFREFIEVFSLERVLMDFCCDSWRSLFLIMN